MVARKIYAVDSKPGLNVRESPSLQARVLRVLRDGEKVTVNNNAAAPDGWKAVQGGGFVMTKFLK